MARNAKRKRGATRRRRKVRLALIGAGRMANKMHYPSLAENPDAELVALCDIIPEKLEETADCFGIGKRYHDYREMLDQVKPEAVYVLMPPHHLFDVCAEVLGRGHHLFVEKPLGTISSQADALARLAEANVCLTAVGFNRRYAPLVVKAKQIADKSGGARLVRTVFHKNSPALYYGGASDALLCDAVHVVDLLRFLGGEVIAIETAVTTFEKPENPDPVPNSWISVMRFENGGVGELSVNWASGARWLYFEMHRPGLSILSELELGMTVKEDDPAGKTYLAADIAKSDEPRIIGGYKQENDHFIECVKRGKQPLTNFADAAESMALAEEIGRGSL